MKNYFIYLIPLLFAMASLTAQIDRSKIPNTGPAPELHLGKTQEFKLKNGLTVLVVTNTKFPVVSWSLNLNTPPIYQGDKAGVQSLTSALLGKETLLTSKDEFNKNVDYLGAKLGISSNGGYGYCLSKYKEEVFKLFAEAALLPKFTEKELDFEKNQLIEAIKAGENSVAAIASNVTKALFYGKNHPAGEIITEETVNNVTLDDVRVFYKSRFKPSDGYLLFTGNIRAKEAKKLLKKYLKSWNIGRVETPSYPEFEDVNTTSVDFVDVPNAVQTEIAVMNVSTLKMNDDDYHAAMLANYILGGDFGSYLNMNLREEHSYTYGAHSVLDTNRFYNSYFKATTKVRNAVTNAAIVEILKEIKRIRTDSVDAKILNTAKAKFLGNFILESEDKAITAKRLLQIKINDLPEDFYKNYITKINAVTLEDIQQVAQKYFNHKKARVVLVGKASAVLENIEKIEWEAKKLPVHFYDKKANPTNRPETFILPAGVSVKTVLNKYLNAIGVTTAKKNNLNSVWEQYEANTPMGKLISEEKRTDDKIAQNIYGNDKLIMTLIATQKGAFTKQGSNKIPLAEQMAVDMKLLVGLFPEINILKMNAAKITGTENVEGKETYKVEVKGDVVSYTLFYDMITGLKVKEIQTIDMQKEPQNHVVILRDYQEYEGLKFPKTKVKTMMGQSAEFKLKEVKINKGVTEADFN